MLRSSIAMPSGEYGYDAPYALVIFGSLALHNIRWNAGRRQAIAEAYRVLKPGGRMVIADIRATRIYADALRARRIPGACENRAYRWLEERFPAAWFTKSPPI
jgi:ubiquinone/menaquinone biosynthesis C-methylase UbiE